MPNSLSELTERLIAFREERDWQRYHSLKNLFVSLNLEAGELLELAQWKNDAEVEEMASDESFRSRLAEESADVLLYLLMICERAGIDLVDAASKKINTNATKYPVDKAKGNARKYTEL